MNARSQGGFSMIEVLVTIAILLVGLLGLGGLQTRVATAEFEAYQRAQALVIIQDIMDRMAANKRNLASYVQDNIGATGTESDCRGLSGAALDVCEINNVVVGATEKAGSRQLGAMLGARVCITSPSANLYIVTVAWQGLIATKEPAAACGANQYGDDKLRRTVSMPVRVATLNVT
jgi:type IV pilus assembly protein PilV